VTAIPRDREHDRAGLSLVDGDVQRHHRHKLLGMGMAADDRLNVDHWRFAAFPIPPRDVHQGCAT
jgi:hypothetical protein